MSTRARQRRQIQRCLRRMWISLGNCLRRKECSPPVTTKLGPYRKFSQAELTIHVGKDINPGGPYLLIPAEKQRGRQ